MPVQDIYHYYQHPFNIATSGQPTASEFDDILAQGYKSVINLALPDSDGALLNEASIVTESGANYVQIPIDFEHPKIEQLKLFMDLLDTLTGQKIWVHCAANFRVSAFMYCYLINRKGFSEDQAKSDIFEFWKPEQVWVELMQAGAQL
ncbi:MAG: protein tyrosine phosphatase family protein [bacterium]